MVGTTHTCASPYLTESKGLNMNPEQILKGLEIAIKIVVGLGGIVGWIAGIWFKRSADKLRANLERETDTHRMRLKKSELLFNKRFEAAASLNNIRYEFYKLVGPRISEKNEFIKALSRHFEPIKKMLNSFLQTHAIILPAQTCELLEEAEGKAYEFCTGFPENEEESYRIEAANLIYNNIREAQDVLQKDILSQAVF